MAMQSSNLSEGGRLAPNQAMRVWRGVFRAARRRKQSRKEASLEALEVLKNVGVGNPQGDTDEMLRQRLNNQGGRSTADFLNDELVIEERRVPEPEEVDYRLAKADENACRTCGYFARAGGCSLLDITTTPGARCDGHTTEQSNDLIVPVQVSYAIKGLIEGEQRITYGAVYMPNEADLQDEWAGYSRAAYGVIEKAAHNWMAKYRWHDLEHSWKPQEAEVVESFIAPCDIHTYFGKALGDDYITEGTWVAAVRWPPDIWQAIKRGEYRGYSIGGFKSVSFADPPAPGEPELIPDIEL